ncbi:hypothetical protein [Sinorhizobium meliloti]|uniref:Uncharacterized protein n=1 Tax=Rhizobium meliloti TaxID=382 RepID=A0A2J0YVE6_RHIML|nr:hypothetical protein [Sinorhizobium meliloti]PJR11502.1 hypothetical protein CEJ86_27435 [Sinorhizobium meliloti]
MTELSITKDERREWFAGQAMAALVTGNVSSDAETRRRLTKEAYALADAMVAEATRESEEGL